MNPEGGSYGNVLQALSTCSYEKTVRLLLDQGADVYARGRKYADVVLAAASNGHDTIVQRSASTGLTERYEICLVSVLRRLHNYSLYI